jgi:hypothetical protein
MYREDLKLDGATPFTTRELYLSFYQTYQRCPVVKEVVAEVFEDLRRAVEQVPGVTFTEDRRR